MCIFDLVHNMQKSRQDHTPVRPNLRIALQYKLPSQCVLFVPILLKWNPHCKRTSLADAASYLNRALVGVHDPFRDRKAKAVAAELPGT